MRAIGSISVLTIVGALALTAGASASTLAVDRGGGPRTVREDVVR